MSRNKRLLIIDSNSVIHRAFHALPPLTTKQGEPVGAVYGFLLVFFKALKDFNPEFLAACFDFPAPTFRHKKFEKYKAKRPPAPPELYLQIGKVKEVLKAFNAAVYEKEGYEADDLIATIASSAPKKQVFPKIETTIISGDMDNLQLVNENTKVCFLKRGVKETILFDEQKVRERYGGLNPVQLVDYKSLRGDPSDNIPGVTGIGEKTAQELLLKFNSLDEIYQAIESSGNLAAMKPKTKELLVKYKEQALISYALAKMEKSAPIDFKLSDCRWGSYDRREAEKMLEKYEFYSLLKRLPGAEKKNGTPAGGIGSNLSLW